MLIRKLHALQDGVSTRLGLAPGRRAEILRAMLAPRAGDAIGYWLQLTMAAALATLGLALDSTAVVIGAMLVAPLMRPIVEFAMGLATGSAPLVFRAGSRAAASMIAVVMTAVVITWLLPFREVTGELAARTAPSLIDLFVAAACALVGAYATLFSTSEMASTAAGTSIGISLVPPLCTAGYGLASGNHAMAIGAGLLFTANITGILVVAGLAFLLIGFGQLGRAVGDHDDDGADDLASQLGRRWQRSRRLGVLSRLVFPVVLLGSIYVPLSRALGDMTHRSHVRSQLDAVLRGSELRIAQSSIDSDAHGITVRAVIVGADAEARRLEARLHDELNRLGEPKARVLVWAVPEAAALGSLASRLDQMPPVPTAPHEEEDLTMQPAAKLRAAVVAVWPPSAGALVDVWASGEGELRLRAVHLGAPVGQPALDVIAQALAPERRVVVEELALAPPEPGGDRDAWLTALVAHAERIRVHPDLRLCITTPPPAPPAPRRARPVAPADPIGPWAIAWLGRAAQVTLSPGAAWSASVAVGGCPSPAPPSGDVPSVVPTNPEPPR